MRSSQYQYGMMRPRLARKPLMSVNGSSMPGSSEVATCGVGATAPAKRPMLCVVKTIRMHVRLAMK